ncbi:MAG TPA: DUF4392 domain-containing protein [Firmicutes bacterium]|jgi:hypothetical protein|nr:DUF4392 domain-containing protein [Bacillota bacterium]
MPEIIGEYVDRLVNLEMRVQGGLPRGVTHKLYEAARKKQGPPLTFLAAQKLIDALKPGDNVIIATGAGVPPWLPKGETDGPLGAASLARALDIGLGVKPIVVGEERTMAPTEASFEAAGVTIVDEKMFNERSHVALAIPYPLGESAGEATAHELMERFKPKAVITVEKHGPSASGMYHSIMGVGRSPDLVANVKFLTDLAQEQDILTIGIGDGGNEIGFGLIYDDVRRIQAYGPKCQCPCGAGVATVSKADVLVATAVSNWGAYGISAMLALMLENRRVLQDTETEYRMLDACIRAGAMDGLYTSQVMYVDGTSSAVQAALITILHHIVDNGLSQQPRHW